MTEALKYLSQTISLPSRGWYYDKENPLSSGEIELKVMTAKEENILSSANLIEKDLVTDKLLKALVINKNINYNDLLIGDKNGIMIAARILGYGKDYPIPTLCPACDKLSVTTIDLQEVSEAKVEFKEENRYKNEMTFKLPVSGKTLTFKFLTHIDDIQIEKETRALESVEEDKDIDLGFTTRLFYTIIAVDGDNKILTRKNFVENEFLAKDSLAFRNHIQSIRPDIDLSVDVTCEHCGNRRRVKVPITSNFFWPGQRI